LTLSDNSQLKRTSKKNKTEKNNLDEAKALLASAQARIALLEESDLEKSRSKYMEALEIYQGLEKKEGISESYSTLVMFLESWVNMKKQLPTSNRLWSYSEI